jgi:hypothetical protein
VRATIEEQPRQLISHPNESLPSSFDSQLSHRAGRVQVQEDDDAWDPEQLLNSVAFEMQAEKDLLAEEEEAAAA